VVSTDDRTVLRGRVLHPYTVTQHFTHLPADKSALQAAKTVDTHAFIDGTPVSLVVTGRHLVLAPDTRARQPPAPPFARLAYRYLRVVVTLPRYLSTSSCGRYGRLRAVLFYPFTRDSLDGTGRYVFRNRMKRAPEGGHSSTQQRCSLTACAHSRIVSAGRCNTLPPNARRALTPCVSTHMPTAAHSYASRRCRLQTPSL